MPYNLKALGTSLRKLMLFQTYPSPRSKFDNDNDNDTIVVVVVVDDKDVVVVDDEGVVVVDNEDVFVVVLQRGCYLELAEDWMGCNGYTMKAQWAAQVRPIRNNDKNEKITRIDK